MVRKVAGFGWEKGRFRMGKDRGLWVRKGEGLWVGQGKVIVRTGEGFGWEKDGELWVGKGEGKGGRLWVGKGGGLWWVEGVLW